MILALLALLPQQAPSTVQLVTPSMVATSLGDAPTRRLRIAGPPADAQAARFRLTLDLDPWEAVGHSLTNLSGLAQSGYPGSTGGWVDARIGSPTGYPVGISFWFGTCGGYPLLPGQTATAGNAFPSHWEGEFLWSDLPADLLDRPSLPVYVTLHAQDMLAPGFAASHWSWVDGSAVHATLAVEYLEE